MKGHHFHCIACMKPGYYSPKTRKHIVLSTGKILCKICLTKGTPKKFRQLIGTI